MEGIYAKAFVPKDADINLKELAHATKGTERNEVASDSSDENIDNDLNSKPQDVREHKFATPKSMPDVFVAICNANMKMFFHPFEILCASPSRMKSMVAMTVFRKQIHD